MIKNKKLGLKIAESPEEALWERVRRARAESIKSLEESLIVEKAFLELAERKLLEFNKNKNSVTK